MYRAGFRKLLMVNGHGGQPQPLQMAMRELRLRHGDFILIMQDIFKVPNCADRFMAEQERQMAMHAGHAETALIMALAPETVQMHKAVCNYPPAFPCPTLSSTRPMAAWVAYDFGPSGVIGDPLPATPEQGEAILDSLASSWARAISEIHQMKWVTRDAPSWGKAHWQGTVLAEHDAASLLKHQ